MLGGWWAGVAYGSATEGEVSQTIVALAVVFLVAIVYRRSVQHWQRAQGR